MKNKRKAYEEKLSAQLEELWNTQLALYKAHADKVRAEAKIEYHEMTEALQRKHDEARAKLQELKAASDEAWEDLKRGAENAWTEVKAALHDAAFKVQIMPNCEHIHLTIISRCLLGLRDILKFIS